METSYVEPLIKPYNELKTIERTRLLFNLINATIHKEISIPMDGIPQVMQEQELLESIATYKDNIVFDNSTGEIYIDGSKDLPYSKEYFFPSVDGKKTEIQFINPEGHDLNENTTLV
jgi:signal transduction protein with GAF and PtsI domain